MIIEKKKSNEKEDESKVNSFINKKMKNSNKKSNSANRYSLIYYENIKKYISVLILMNIYKLPEYKAH